jgi:hypothetical protein
MSMAKRMLPGGAVLVPAGGFCWDEATKQALSLLQPSVARHGKPINQKILALDALVKLCRLLVRCLQVQSLELVRTPTLYSCTSGTSREPLMTVARAWRSGFLLPPAAS